MIGLFFDFDVRGARSRAAFAVIHFDVHGVGASSYAAGIPARLRARALDRAAGGCVRVGQRIIIGIAGVHVHGHAVARTSEEDAGLTEHAASGEWLGGGGGLGIPNRRTKPVAARKLFCRAVAPTAGPESVVMK